MNWKSFHAVMHAVDDDLLEQAQQPQKRRPPMYTFVAAAACICLVASSLLIWQSHRSSTAQLANPLQETTAADLAALGYTMPLPEAAESPTYTLIALGDAEAVPMAQATFTCNQQEYTYRALKTEQSADISGVYGQWTESLDWTADQLEMQLRSDEEGVSWVGWYDPAEETQWCLSGQSDGLTILHTAQEIVATLGYDMAVAPEGAEAITYNAFMLDDLTVGETTFVLDGISYSYRTASTYVIEEEFADISGVEGATDILESGEIGWCPARLCYTEGGEGRILWFDVVPGLLYSLHMDSGASEEAL